jgi:hypothetical protein
MVAALNAFQPEAVLEIGRDPGHGAKFKLVKRLVPHG